MDKIQEILQKDDTFGHKVRDIREYRLSESPVFTLRQVSRAIGISPTYLSKIENDEIRPGVETITHLAEHLSVNPDELLCLAERIAPDVEGIARKPLVADFLRTVGKLTDQEIANLKVFAEFQMSQKQGGGKGEGGRS